MLFCPKGSVQARFLGYRWGRTWERVESPPSEPRSAPNQEAQKLGCCGLESELGWQWEPVHVFQIKPLRETNMFAPPPLPPPPRTKQPSSHTAVDMWTVQGRTPPCPLAEGLFPGVQSGWLMATPFTSEAVLFCFLKSWKLKHRIATPPNTPEKQPSPIPLSLGAELMGS